MRQFTTRGSAMGEGLQWILRIAAAAILLLALLAQIWIITEHKKSPDLLELRLYEERLLNGPNGIYLAEPGTGRILPGVLDLSKLDSHSLNTAYSGGDTAVFGARLRVYLNARDIDTEGKSSFPEAYHNEELTRVYLPLGRAGLSGTGGALYERHVIPVVIGSPAEYNGRTLAGTPAWLEIEAVKRT